MRRSCFLPHLAIKTRDLSYLPGLRQLKYAFRHLQALAQYAEFQQLRRLVASLPLAPLLAQQPRFAYKYLGNYLAASFSRPARLAAITHHYTFLAAAVRPDFFTAVAQQPIVWQEQVGGEHFTIRLSYPLRTQSEGELSLNFFRGPVLLQMLTFTIVPGRLIGSAVPHAVLVSQVQGTRDAAAIRLATKHLHDITPAMLLLYATYGLAAALGIGYVAGVSNQEQLRFGEAQNHFDYNSFWQQFWGVQLASTFYLFDVHAGEKPLEEIKPKYRQRTLRKRAYRQRVRQAVAASWQAHFMPQGHL